MIMIRCFVIIPSFSVLSSFPPFLVYHFSRWYNGWIETWLQRGMKESAEEIAQLFSAVQ